MLLTLVDGERHAYGIKKDLAARGAHRDLGPGTLYRSIAQLIDAGLIDESDRRPVAELDDERRRYYRLTPLAAGLWLRKPAAGGARHCRARPEADSAIEAGRDSPPPVRLAETTFRWLMRAYPARFRRSHGLAMFELFRDEAREAYAAGGASGWPPPSRARRWTPRGALQAPGSIDGTLPHSPSSPSRPDVDFRLAAGRADRRPSAP